MPAISAATIKALESGGKLSPPMVKEISSLPGATISAAKLKEYQNASTDKRKIMAKPLLEAIKVAQAGLAKKGSFLDNLDKDKKIGLGLGLGAGALLFLGAPILLPVALAGGAIYKYRGSKPKGLTPEQKKIYENALKSKSMTPAQLRQLAEGFLKAGAKEEASLLKKRAKLREMPPEVHSARKQVMKAALKSTNISGIEGVAAAFEGEGATGCAAKLRAHAHSLKAM